MFGDVCHQSHRFLHRSWPDRAWLGRDQTVCVSRHLLAIQFDQTNKHRAKVVFEAFYWIINFGSFFASLLMPIFLRHLGPAVAFGVPAS